jgi:hypothetical protein
VTACIDSDVLIDYFDGILVAAEELSRYEDLVIVESPAWRHVGATPTDGLRASPPTGGSRLDFGEFTAFLSQRTKGMMFRSNAEEFTPSPEQHQSSSQENAWGKAPS